MQGLYTKLSKVQAGFMHSVVSGIDMFPGWNISDSVQYCLQAGGPKFAVHSTHARASWDPNNAFWKQGFLFCSPNQLTKALTGLHGHLPTYCPLIPTSQGVKC